MQGKILRHFFPLRFLFSYLAPCKDNGRESAYSLQKASQLAGSSKRLVGSALGNAAKGMM